MESKEYKKIFAYMNQQIKKLSNTIPEIDLSNYYTKSETETLIPIIPTIPDELKDLLEDTTHRLVNDTEKNKLANVIIFTYTL